MLRCSCVLAFGGSEERNGDTVFLMLEWDRYRYDKKGAETCYIKLVILHSVSSASHVVHSGASAARNGDVLFFMLGWD
jgi:hypothetical protein